MSEDYPPPNITDVNPYWGKPGQTGIKITGDNLAATSHATFTVNKTSKKSPISEHSGNTEVSTSVPKDMPTGNGGVTVTSPGGTSNSLDFTVQA